MAPKYMLLVLSLVSFVRCENKTLNRTDQTTQEEISSVRRGREIRSYIGLVTCAMKYDVSCFVDAAENYLEVRRTELLAQADAEVLQSTGRSDPESRPSHIANTLGRLISELTNIFRNGISGYFKEGRETTDDDDDDNDDDDDDELGNVTTSDSNAVSGRGKKYDPVADGKTKKVLLNEGIMFLKITTGIASAALLLTIPAVLLGVGIITLKCLIGVGIAIFVLLKKLSHGSSHGYHD